MRLLDRYVVREITAPFFVGLCTFCMVLLAIDPFRRAAKMLGDEQFTKMEVLEFILGTIPGIMVYAFPMSALLACLIAFGRMSADSEIVAMKAGGISFYRIALPGLLTTLCIALVALYLTDRIVPEANYRSRAIMYKMVARSDEIKNVQMQTMAQDQTERVVLARKLEIDKGLLETLTIVFYNGKRLTRVLHADQAIYTDGQWVMKHVRTQEIGLDGNPTAESTSDEMILPEVESPDKLKNRRRGRDEMSRRQLLAAARVEMISQGGQLTPVVNSYLVDYCSRIAVPFSCFVFGLFGIPLGIQPQRSSKSIGIGVALVCIIVYYIFISYTFLLGEHGVLSPLAATWLPNIVFGIAGTVLMVRAGRV